MTTIIAAAALCALQAAPQEGAWRPIASAGAPTARSDETALWTGREAVLFGGLDAAERYLADGAAYDPATDTWRPLATTGAPSTRAWHTAVWTGSEMIVWGGHNADADHQGGGAYDPRADRWKPLTTQGAPAARGSHLAVWTGDAMLVWAGVDDEHAFPRGGLYDPSRDEWRPLVIDAGERTPRTLPGIWTGTAFLAWGGINGGAVLGHGVWCDPATGAQRFLAADAAPSARAEHAAVWTGSELVVWGGSASIRGGRPFADGARYDPALDRWSPLTTEGAPPARFAHAFVWSGSELLILGGATQAAGDALRDAWAWHPERGWRRLPDLPEPRAHAHVFVTEQGVLLIGGRDATQPRRGGYLLVR